MGRMTLVNLNMLYMRSTDTIEREVHVPLGPLYLTAALERAGHEVDFRDYQLSRYDDPFDTKSIVDFLQDPAPVLGVSCMANLLPFTILALREFKRRYPEVTVVMGGVGPTAVEREILTEFDWIDVVVRGEAEISGPMLMTALETKRPLESVPGISFRQNGQCVSTPAAPRLEDLDSLGLPAYHKIDLRQYQGYNMVTSRGCPFPCTFCSVAPIWGRLPKLRSVDNIIKEVRFLYTRHGVDMFLFQDEYFISTAARCREFCDKLRATRMPVKWKCFGRINLTTREMMEEMTRSGCVELRFGVESGSERILKRTRKGFTPGQAIPVISEAARLFNGVDAFYIWGFPFETMQDFEQSLFQMVTFRMMGVRILPSMLCLLPQTQIYRDYIDTAPLTFCKELFPDYMVTGHEIKRSARISILEKHRVIFDFIENYPRIFPGFFHIGLEQNILPKLRKLETFGFYTSADPDNCDAESSAVQTKHLTTSPVVT
ncbi:B12-binding domain-containing radical SAM protein [bacterium]|nr:B12-binding domain-containing radical SAM protein [candidate division CSSED10-310 bacterium]